MFLNGKTPSLPRRFRLVFTSFLNHPSLPFADAVTEQTIEEAFDQEGVSFGEDEDAVYTPAITLWAFLSQVLFKGEQRSCVGPEEVSGRNGTAVVLTPSAWVVFFGACVP